MESKSVSFYNELKKAALDSDQVLFEEILKKRAVYIESIQLPTEKKEVLEYFIEKDKELATISNKKTGSSSKSRIQIHSRLPEPIKKQITPEPESKLNTQHLDILLSVFCHITM